MIDYDSIMEKIDKLPSLSPTISKILQIANDINTSPRELVTVIKLDPVLTAKVLKMVNSAYFSLPQEVTSLERAIIMLGLNTIKNLALSSAVLGRFHKNIKTSFFDLDAYWKHSLAVAVVSKIAAIKLKIPKNYREEFFIAGLLHDIGKLILLSFYSDEFAFILNKVNETQLPLIMIENRELQFTHPEIGEKIAQKWKLSKNLTSAIAYHHAPDFSAEVDAEFKLIASVYIANYYCNKQKLGFSGEINIPEINPIVWEKLQLDKDDFLKFLEIVEDELKKAEEFLKIL
jgi:putative nucleotidyltransferase with HDIG domain